MIRYFVSPLCEDKESFVSTLSWGILYDSFLFKVDICFRVYICFNPLLRNSLWFNVGCFWIIFSFSEGFNPLLRNSLWFYQKASSASTAIIHGFNPLLRNSLWFIYCDTDSVMILEKDVRVSTLSWGILYDSGKILWLLSPNNKMFQPSLEEFFMILVYIHYDSNRSNRSSFNPLLRNSLWFEY